MTNVKWLDSPVRNSAVPLAGEVLRLPAAGAGAVRLLVPRTRTLRFTTSEPTRSTPARRPGYAGIHWHVDLGQRRAVRLGEATSESASSGWRSARSERRLEALRQPVGRRGRLRRTEQRTLDCIDCHNRATDIDEGDGGRRWTRRIRRGRIDRTLPFAKREVLRGHPAGLYRTGRRPWRASPGELRGRLRDLVVLLQRSMFNVRCSTFVWFRLTRLHFAANRFAREERTLPQAMSK